jgi:hypothetical protein
MSNINIATESVLPENWDWLTQIFSVNIGGIEGMIGMMLGIIIISLISFKFEDWAKTLAPVYFILASLGVLINPLAIMGSAIWFSITIWNETGWTVKGLSQLTSDVTTGFSAKATGIGGATTLRESKINKLLAKDKTNQLRNASSVQISKNDSLMDKLSPTDRYSIGLMNDKESNRITRENLDKFNLLKTDANQQAKLNKIKNKPFEQLQKAKESFTTKQNKLNNKNNILKSINQSMFSLDMSTNKAVEQINWINGQLKSKGMPITAFEDLKTKKQYWIDLATEYDLKREELKKKLKGDFK